MRDPGFSENVSLDRRTGRAACDFSGSGNADSAYLWLPKCRTAGIILDGHRGPESVFLLYWEIFRKEKKCIY